MREDVTRDEGDSSTVDDLKLKSAQKYDSEEGLLDLANALQNEPDNHMTLEDALQLSENTPENYIDIPDGINSWAPTRPIAHDLNNIDLSEIYKIKNVPKFKKFPESIFKKIDFKVYEDHSWKKPRVEEARKIIQQQSMWSNKDREQMLKVYARAIHRQM